LHEKIPVDFTEVYIISKELD